MKPPTPSPTFIVQNWYGYCLSIKVPKDLQAPHLKKELRDSLKKGYLGLAKSRARIFPGLFQQLFQELREKGFEE